MKKVSRQFLLALLLFIITIPFFKCGPLSPEDKEFLKQFFNDALDSLVYYAVEEGWKYLRDSLGLNLDSNYYKQQPETTIVIDTSNNQPAVDSSITLYKVDLRPWLITPKSQGEQSSCVGWASSALRSFHYNWKYGFRSPNGRMVFSPSFVYNHIKVSDNCKEGSNLADAAKLLTDSGIVPINEFPYFDYNCSAQADYSLWSEAKQYRISAYRRVDERNIEELKQWLRNANPILSAIIVDDVFIVLNGNQVYTEKGLVEQGSHAILVIGYDDYKYYGTGQGAFLLYNSWGESWGDNGYGWISYSAFEQIVQETYIFIDN